MTSELVPWTTHRGGEDFFGMSGKKAAPHKKGSSPLPPDYHAPASTLRTSISVTSHCLHGGHYGEF